MPGFGIMRVFFHPNVSIDLAIAQLTAMTANITRFMPPGMFPPTIIRYNAAGVPILQLAVGSKSLSEQQIYDITNQQLRVGLATVQGASMPLPYGGRVRQIMVDLNAQALQARGLSATDVSTAINAQNLIIPSGTAKIGTREYNIRLNSSPEAVEAINMMPIKQVNGATVYVKDIGNVRDGFAVQGNVVRQNGTRGALVTILKNGSTSTLEIIDRIQKALDRVQTLVPKELEIQRLFDQSVYVRASIDGVLHEGLIAAGLTGLMILLFLGSWRSTLIVCVSIPLSILVSLFCLNLLGQTINVMTLGGLALAVGILVDDATVEIENIHRNLHQKKPLLRAILDGAQQIAVPTFVSTLSICIVFVPVIFLTSTARFLFTPLALAVVFAHDGLLPVVAHAGADLGGLPVARRGGAVSAGGRAGGARADLGGASCFQPGVPAAAEFLPRSAGLVAGSSVRHSAGGADLHRLQLRGGRFRGPRLLSGRGWRPVPAARCGAPAGTRIEETEQHFARVEETIRRVIPAREIDTIIDNIGLPWIGVNLAYTDGATVGRFDGEILVALKQGHAPTFDYVARLRQVLDNEYPDLEFFFQPADMISQILNFGPAGAGGHSGGRAKLQDRPAVRARN